MDGVAVEAHLDRRDKFECWLTLFGQRFHVVSICQGASSRIEINGLAHSVDRDDWGVVHAPAPAVVVSVTVKPGDVVAQGDRLAVLEAMKMETQVVAPFAGKIREVFIISNVQVDTGAPLVQIEAADREESTAPQDRIVLGASKIATTVEDAPYSADNLKTLRQLMLGFDLDPASTLRNFAASTQPSGDSETARRAEGEILNIFIDICSIFHREPNVNHRMSAEEPAAETLFFSYLRLVETKGEDLPAYFVVALRRALSYYGIRTLDSTLALKESLLWICKSHARMDQQVSAILNILERRLKNIPAPEHATNGSFRTLLDRLTAITHDLYPALSDLASELRYRYFDQPAFENARTHVYDEAEEHLNFLAVQPDSPERHVRIRALIECPQLLAGLMAGRFPTADSVSRQTMLEILTARYYRTRSLQKLSSAQAEGYSYVIAEYDYEGKRIHAIATCADYGELCVAAKALSLAMAAVPPDHDVVVDFHLSKRGALADADSTQADISKLINTVPFPRALRRIVVSVAGICPGQRLSQMQHFTYRSGEAGYQEEVLYRGVHPMMGKRLHL
jgi:hypothetical protein